MVSTTPYYLLLFVKKVKEKGGGFICSRLIFSIRLMCNVCNLTWLLLCVFGNNYFLSAVTEQKPNVWETWSLTDTDRKQVVTAALRTDGNSLLQVRTV